MAGLSLCLVSEPGKTLHCFNSLNSFLCVGCDGLATGQGRISARCVRCYTNFLSGSWLRLLDAGAEEAYHSRFVANTDILEPPGSLEMLGLSHGAWGTRIYGNADGAQGNLEPQGARVVMVIFRENEVDDTSSTSGWGCLRLTLRKYNYSLLSYG